ncbi:hypothetical protein ABPG72_001101 [Tetrahymena utriculariae]
MNQGIEDSKKNDLFKFLDMPLQINRQQSKQKVPGKDFKEEKPEKGLEILKNIENFDDYCTEFLKFEKQMNAKYNIWKQNQKQISLNKSEQPEKLEKENAQIERIPLKNSSNGFKRIKIEQK